MNIKGFKDTIDWYDNNAEEYADGLYKVVPIDAIEYFLKYLAPDAYVLEAGCGPGRESKVFFDKGIKTIGIDISEGLLKVARRVNPQVEFVKGDFLNLPFKDETFNGVWSHASLVHLETIEEVEKALSEFRRVLKEGGILFVKVKAQMGSEKTEIVTDSLSKHDRFFRFYKDEEILDLIQQAGFHIEESRNKDDEHGRSEVKWIEIIGKKL